MVQLQLPLDPDLIDMVDYMLELALYWQQRALAAEAELEKKKAPEGASLAA